MSVQQRIRPRPMVALAAFALGVVAVLGYDWALGSYRYPYSGDSASYVEMATSLLRDGRPRVTPWDLDPPDRDSVPQPLFPPGYSVLIAALTPLVGDARVAALYPARVAAALLPLLVVVLFRGLVADAALAVVAALALLSPGVREWHYFAYSDVPALALAVIALGALARGLDLREAGGRHAARWMLLAGFGAGSGYAVRNAGLAVLAISLLTLLYARIRGVGPVRASLYWLAGAAPPLAGLWSYNLATFGRLLPYDMPRSARAWSTNVVDYAAAQLADLGVPAQLLNLMPAPLVVLAIAGIAALYAAAAWRLRHSPARQTLLLLLAGYAGAGATLLVASRTRYEWGGTIDGRNVLQYTFAYALALVLAAEVSPSARVRRYGWPLAVLALGSLLTASLSEVAAASRHPEDTWRTLAEDRIVISSARALPANVLVASNAAVLFRLAVPRPVRNLEVSGDDRDFAGSLAALANAAGGRPSAFLLVCNEWTVAYTACAVTRTAAHAAPSCQRLRAVPPVVALCAPPPAALRGG